MTTTTEHTTNLDPFWAHIEDQLQQLTEAKTADDVMRILPPVDEFGQKTACEGWFGGGGGDVRPNTPLRKAGWKVVWAEANYYWVMQAPNGDLITYVEGDIERGNTATR